MHMRRKKWLSSHTVLDFILSCAPPLPGLIPLTETRLTEPSALSIFPFPLPKLKVRIEEADIEPTAAVEAWRWPSPSCLSGLIPSPATTPFSVKSHSLHDHRQNKRLIVVSTSSYLLPSIPFKPSVRTFSLPLPLTLPNSESNEKADTS